MKIFINNVRDKVGYITGSEIKVFQSSYEGLKISHATVTKYLKKFCMRAGIKKKISTHCFRHSFGSHLLENGLGIKEVSDLLGHESLSSTERYTRLSPERLRKVLVKCHPREKDRA